EDSMFKYINNVCPREIEHFTKQLNEIKNGESINYPEKESIISTLENRKNSILNYSKGLTIKLNNTDMVETKYKQGEFILAYFNAKRDSKVFVPTSVNKVELQTSYTMDADIDTKFLDYLVYLKTQQSFARNEDDLEMVKSIGSWFDNFEKSLKDLFEDNSIKLKFDYKNLNFKIQQNGREDFGLNELSDGFSAVLDILMNLILRMENNRQGLSYSKEGIVLIDEVETHLHIGLQKRILPFLTSFFPNIQFIVTTHSPFVLNSIDDAVVYDLENKIKLEDLSSYSYDGIVEGYFNVDKYSKEAKDKIYRYKMLGNKEDKNEEEEIEEIKLKNYLKNVPETLASEVVFEFKSIELSKLKRRNV
ncbi:MAG: AAA family ATPase, partial [Clostridium sp.]